MIPNPIDITVYRPINKNTARSILHLPADKKLILFGAMNPTDNRRKGFHLLKSALEILRKDGSGEDWEIIVFGGSKKETTELSGFPIHYLGKIPGEVELSLVYSSADVFVAPSLLENLANTVLESITCGTPVVAFNVGGMPDMIIHTVNGYLAQPFEISDLANGISWILSDDKRWENLSRNARKKAVQDCEYSVVARKYVEIYNSMIEKK